MAKFEVQTTYSDKLAKNAAAGNKPMLSRVPEHLRVNEFDRTEHLLGHGNPFGSVFNKFNGTDPHLQYNTFNENPLNQKK